MLTNIYLITNKLNGKQYVGKTIHSIERRFSEHCICDKTNHTYIDNAIKKHGKENFTVELIMRCEDWRYWEHECIKRYHTHWTEGGYNLSWGGDHNPMEDDLVRKRHLDACRSKSHRNKQRQASLGRKHTLESRQKMSRIQKELYSDPNMVKKVKLRQPNRFPVDMLDDNDNVIASFDTLGDACRYCNRPATDSGCLKQVVDKFNKNGKRAKFFGHAWTKHIDKV